MAGFRWTKQASDCVLLLAQGHTIEETSELCGKSVRQIYRWKRDIEFLSELDRLSLMVLAASKAERLRITNRMVKKLTREGRPTTKDLLDWLKYAQSETDGIKLDLTSLLEAASSVAGRGSERIDRESGDPQPEHDHA